MISRAGAWVRPREEPSLRVDGRGAMREVAACSVAAMPGWDSRGQKNALGLRSSSSRSTELLAMAAIGDRGLCAVFDERLARLRHGASWGRMRERVFDRCAAARLVGSRLESQWGRLAHDDHRCAVQVMAGFWACCFAASLSF